MRKPVHYLYRTAGGEGEISSNLVCICDDNTLWILNWNPVRKENNIFYEPFWKLDEQLPEIPQGEIE